MSSDRLELEAELGRLQAELFKIKKEKAQQRRKIHELQREQTLLHQQQQRPATADSFQIKQNQEEHTRAQVAYGKTKSQYRQLKQTVFDLHGSGESDSQQYNNAIDLFSSDDDNSVGGDDEEFANNQDFLSGLWGKDAKDQSHNESMRRLADAFDSNAGFGDLTGSSKPTPSATNGAAPVADDDDDDDDGKEGEGEVPHYQQLRGLSDDSGDEDTNGQRGAGRDPKYKARLAKKKRTKRSNRLNLEDLASGNDDGTVVTKDSIQMTKDKRRGGGNTRRDVKNDFDDEGTVMTRDSLSLARAKIDVGGGGGGGDDAATVTTKDSLQMVKERTTATRKKQRKPTGLGNFLDGGGKSNHTTDDDNKPQGMSLGDHFERLK